MQHRRPPLLLLPLLLFPALALLLHVGAPRSTLAGPVHEHLPTGATEAAGSALLSAMPVAFVPNLGQWDHPARHVVRLGAMTVLLEGNGWMFTLADRSSKEERSRGVAVRMTLAGAGATELVAEERLGGEHNYFLGSDPARWRTGVPRFRQVRYRAPWPGTDVVCYVQHGHFEYDLVLAPGADLASMEIEVEGAERLWIDGDGALVIETAMGPVRQPKPVTWEVGPGGARCPLPATHELRGASRFGFTAPGWSGERELVLDPGLVYSTFVGGAGAERAHALATDAAGVITIAGLSASVGSYPTTPGAWDTSHNGGWDAFVTRLDPALPVAQQLLWSTFVGGSGNDWAQALSVAASGVVTITGETTSTNYPVTPGAFDTTHNGGGYDVFLTRLDPSLPAAQQLVYSTFVGGSAADHVADLSTDASGVVTVAGMTLSANHPTTGGAFDTTFNGGSDAFVTRLDPSLPGAQQLVWSTFVGGAQGDWLRALSVDTSGVVTITGDTGSATYPTTPGAWSTTFIAPSKLFVTRLDPGLPAAQQLVYSTFLGGSGNMGDLTLDLWVDASGVVTATGIAGNPNFPTTPGAFDTTFNGNIDAFVILLDPSQPTAQQLVYSTFVGGSGQDWGRSLACDSSGVVTIAGYTYSTNYPTTPGAFDQTHTDLDAFVTRLDPARPGPQQLLYSTFLGSIGEDYLWALAPDASGGVTVAGHTTSLYYPTTPNAFDVTGNGSEDVFVTRLDMLPTGVSAFGRSSPGCAGPLPISVTSMPSIGNAGFAITCGNAPPGGLGLLLAGGAGLASPINVLGVEVWIDPNPFLVTFGVTSNGVGAAEFALPIPGSGSLVGTRLFTQFGWVGSASPPPCPPLGVSASNALDITIQP